MPGVTASPAAAAGGFRAVFSAPEFRALWAGQAQSIAGDQLARVALTVLVYDRTRSPLLTAAAYAASYVPWLIGGLVLGSLADRWPRRTVLVRCDLGRGALVAAMALPGMPLLGSVALQFAVTSLDGPFDAARAGTLRDILPGDRYRLGVAVAGSTVMTAVTAGYAAGGVLVGTIGARPALALDAATFLVSAAVIRLGVAARPAAGAASRLPVAARVTSGLALVFADRRLRTCMLFGWLTAVYTVPSALAVPVAAGIGGGPAAAGLV
ncbi:MAG: MFS transporter, partial [Streptosporangiaceae bacterium]